VTCSRGGCLYAAPEHNYEMTGAGGEGVGGMGLSCVTSIQLPIFTAYVGMLSLAETIPGKVISL
jgi:hypothetical protein